LTERGGTLLHEMSHSVLGTVHKGTPKKTFPGAFFDCSVPLGLTYNEAKQNAFAYEILADCLHGEQLSEVVPRQPLAAAKAPSGAGSRWSISVAAGAAGTPQGIGR